MSSGNSNDGPVIRCYNDLGISTAAKARFTSEGTFVADYGSGWSLSSEQVDDADHKSAAGNAFNRIIDLTERGGLGLIRTRTDDEQIISVGEWRPNCGTFREINGTKLKGAQMYRYGLITPDDSPHYTQLDELYQQGGATVVAVENGREAIESALHWLDSVGRLRSPHY